MDVPPDVRPCVFCDQPMGDDRKALAFTAEGLRWAHSPCAVRMNGRGRSLLIPGMGGSSCA